MVTTPTTQSTAAPAKTTVNNTYNVYCKADKLMPSMGQMTSSMGSVNESLGVMQTAISDMAEILREILKVQAHVHDCHWHATTHYAEQGVEGVEIGGLYMPSQPDELSLLMQESQSGIDKDNNGLVYCTDFVIDDNDPNKPLALRDIELHFMYDGIKLPSKSMTWQSYLGSLPWCSD